ncbi:hypothetical protein GCK32_022584, partial [Trichostrongylus colubriformis]
VPRILAEQLTYSTTVLLNHLIHGTNLL